MASIEKINGMEIFNEGFKAFQNNTDRAFNPYTTGSLEWAKWDQGWFEAQQDQYDMADYQ